VFDVHFLRQDPLTENGNHFDWHIDNHDKDVVLRRSMIILLRKTESLFDYAVGFYPNKKKYTFSNVGEGVMFSSSIPHITWKGSGVCMKVVIFFSDRKEN